MGRKRGKNKEGRKGPSDQHETAAEGVTAESATPCSERSPQPDRQAGPAASAGSEGSREMTKRRTDDEPSKASAEAKREQQSVFKPPARSGDRKVGTLGVPVSLEANLFEMKIPENLEVFHYDVAVSPERKGNALKNIVKAFLRDQRFQFSRCFIAYIGGKSFYTRQQIPGLDHLMEFPFPYNEPGEDPSRGREYVVSVQPTGQTRVSFTELRDYLRNGSSVEMPNLQLQVLDIIMKQFSSARPNVTMIRSSFFTPPTGFVELSPGVSLWRGHFQSVRPVSWKIVLNLDTAYKALVKEQYVHEWLQEIYGQRVLQSRGLSDKEKQDFAKQLNRLRVCYKTKWLNKKTVKGLAGPANTERFVIEVKEGDRIVKRETTVAEYFASEYRVQLQYPHLPCVLMASTNADRRILVPMEICKILPNQSVFGKLTDQQTRVMILKTAQKPVDRKASIRKIRSDLRTEQNELLKEFGITVDTEMMKLEGRVLAAPPLTYKGEKVAKPYDGKWDMRQLQFLEVSAMDQWGILYIESSEYKNPDITYDELDLFIRRLVRVGENLGIRVGHPHQKDCPPDERAVSEAMRAMKKEFKNLKLLVVITRSKSDPLYKTIKTVGDTELQLTTQCVQRDNVRFPKDPVLANIFLKINPKLGGINLLIKNNNRLGILNIPKEQVMIMGADVTHPGSQQKPSIAAVVASVDPDAFQYAAEISIQPPRQEMIRDMEEMVVKLLRKFHRINRSTSSAKPTKIIFYRDGVSEGQFEEVLNFELSAIQKACRRVGGDDYRPGITFIVVQKRHNVRFFRLGSDNGKQIQPGTVVDTHVTHPTEFDFYLNSHASIQGTSRPAHYHLLYDDSDFTADQIEELTYQLCHMFTRCTRSVSYPAPCYYAHLVAERGSCYYDALMPANRRYDESMAPRLQGEIDKINGTKFMFFV